MPRDNGNEFTHAPRQWLLYVFGNIFWRLHFAFFKESYNICGLHASEHEGEQLTDQAER